MKTFAERELDAAKLMANNMSFKVQTTNQDTGKATIVAYYDARLVFEILDALYPDAWSTELGDSVISSKADKNTISVKGTIKIHHPEYTRSFSDMGALDQGMRQTGEMATKGAASSAIKRAAVQVNRVFRMAYDYPMLTFTCTQKNKRGEWMGPPPWEINKWAMAELKRKGYDPIAEFKKGVSADVSLRGVEEQSEDDESFTPAEIPKAESAKAPDIAKAVSPRAEQPKAPLAENWSDFWTELASKGGELRKLGIAYRAANPNCTIAELKKALKI